MHSARLRRHAVDGVEKPREGEPAVGRLGAAAAEGGVDVLEQQHAARRGGGERLGEGVVRQPARCERRRVDR
eukprot:6213608-Pleurochrysis_carterae.AAC.7